jgi:methyltransferase family protein
LGAFEQARHRFTRHLPPEVKQGVSSWLARRGVEVANHYTGKQHIALDPPWDHVVRLDYPPSADDGPRWNPHPGLMEIMSRGNDDYRAALDVIRRSRDEFPAIDVHPTSDSEPSWVNGWQPGLDGGAIYGFLRDRSPVRYVEIGSGTSTKFARRAVRDGSLPTEIVSIDPVPRTEVNDLCDRMIRQSLETADLSIFGELTAGDIVFFDGSHRIYTNSDATVFFLEILPKLPAGVLVGIHDIYLPYDYPHWISYRYYSEQYLLAAYLLAGQPFFRTVLPAWYVWQQPAFRPDVDTLFEDPRLREVPRHGAAFWIETR